MIRAKVYDNEFIMENDPDYVRMLQNLPYERRKAMLDGDWDAFEGQFLPEFSREVHVVKPFKPDSSYRIFRTRDYGLDMAAVYWAACDYENNFYIYKELYESNLIVSEAGRKINDILIFINISIMNNCNRIIFVGADDHIGPQIKN